MSDVSLDNLEVYLFLKANPDLAMVMPPDGNHIYTLLDIKGEERFLDVVYNPEIHAKPFHEMTDDELCRQIFNLLISELNG